MVNILTGTPFDVPKRLNHREDEVALEFPSSAGSRSRGLLALKAMNWRASGHAPVQSGLYYSYDVVAGSSVQSLGLTVNGAAQIDWGDGTVQTWTSNLTHTYATDGEYTVRVVGDVTSITTTGTKDRLTELYAVGMPGLVTLAIPRTGFNGANRLRLVDLPVSKVQNGYPFYRANGPDFSLIKFPNLVEFTGDGGLFNDCTVNEIIAPKVRTLGTWAVGNTYGLTRADLSSVMSISGSNVFQKIGRDVPATTDYYCTIKVGMTTDYLLANKSICGSPCKAGGNKMKFVCSDGEVEVRTEGGASANIWTVL